jgi:hypothetical protein
MIAGLNVLHIILDKAATTAIAYGLNEKKGESQIIVYYDLGGNYPLDRPRSTLLLSVSRLLVVSSSSQS